MAKSALDRIKGVVKGGAAAVTKVVPEEERALTVNKVEDSKINWWEMERAFDSFLSADFANEDAPFVSLAIRQMTEYHRQTWEGTLKVDFPHIDKTLRAHGLKRVYSVTPMVLYVWSLGMLRFRKDPKIRDRYTITLVTANKIAAQAIIEAIGVWVNLSGPPSPETMVHTIIKVGEEYEIVPLAPMTKSLERDNYDDNVLTGFDLIAKQFGSDKPVSRLALITGPSATGKTALITGLVAALPKQICVYVPVEMADMIGSPKFLRCLMKQSGKPLVLIIEDTFTYHDVNSILHFATNFVGTALNLRVLISTPKLADDVAVPLKAPGRLLEHLQPAPLTPEHANKLYAKLTKGASANFTAPTTLGEVYALANAFTIAKK